MVNNLLCIEETLFRIFLELLIDSVPAVSPCKLLERACSYSHIAKPPPIISKALLGLDPSVLSFPWTPTQLLIMAALSLVLT